MLKFAIFLSILTTYVKAAAPECWSNNSSSGFYQCCPEGTETVYSDAEGEWGSFNGRWCGIRTPVSNATKSKEKEREELTTNLCWSMAGGFPCCEPGTQKQYIDQDGVWGTDAYGNWCGMWNSLQQWNDRERNEETRKEWEDFKLVWDDYKSDFQRLSIFPGEDERYLNFGWYSTTKTTPSIKYSTNSNMKDAISRDGKVTAHYKLKGVQYYSNKVTIDDLKPNTDYYFQRMLNGEWESRKIHFKTRDPYNFNFIFVGDPQIGGSHDRYTITNNYERVLTVDEGTRNDAFNWNRTIVHSFAKAKTPSILLSAGDQADEECRHLGEEGKGDEELYNEETQYSAFLLPELMQTIPVAATVGNHDAANSNFRHHFNSPNPFETPEYQGLIPGYNYYFRHYNVLVVVLETNYGSCDDFTAVIEEAVAKYNTTDWRIAMFHHDIYGNGITHSTDPYLTDELRPCLTRLFTDNSFDLVINGHDHVYTASKFVIADGDNYKVKSIETNKAYSSPKGTLFITANCSTGSKLYSYYDDDPDYVYKNDQTFSSTFGILDFKIEKGIAQLTVNTYEVENVDHVTDGPYILQKPAKCWSKRLGYDCCKNSNTPVYETDKDGQWGLENDQWCGIGFEKDSSKTKTTTTTKTIPKTTSTKNATTTTKSTTAKITTTTTTTTTKTTTKTTTTTTRTTTTTSPTPQQTNCAAQYAQCGGINFNGPNCCQNGLQCQFISDYYYQCL